MKNIVLVGMMGSGKTTIGSLLNLELPKHTFIDIDEEIISSEKMSINKIFEKYGEGFFRKLENKFIKKFSLKPSLIISTGGGALENIDNIKNLQERGILFYLKATPQSLYNRLKNDTTRPMLKNGNLEENIKKLVKKREKNYNLADYTIDTTDKEPKEIVKEIIEYYEQF